MSVDHDTLHDGLDALAARFWPVFSRAIGHAVAPGRYTVAQVDGWDSLRHVELVFELEEAFGVSIPPAAIATLYSDTDTVLAFLRSQTALAR